MGEHRRFALPDIGEGLIEAELLRWHVGPGDAIEVNQAIVEIETAKAVVELPSPYTGTVVELHVAEGATADVGAPLLTIAVEDGQAGPPAARGPDAAPVDGPTRVDEPMLVGYGAEPAAVAAAGARPSADGRRVAAAPPVRRLARELGVDLAAIAGSGPGGSVTRADLRRAAASPAAAPPAAASPEAAAEPEEERIPVTGVRRRTAAAMVRSAFTAPHVTTWVQEDVTGTMEAVRRLRELPEFGGVKVSPLLLAARALVVAVRRNPAVNATFDEAAQEIVVRRRVNLGIAVATGRGLIVPNVKDAGALSLRELAGALAELVGAARAGRCTPRDLAGGTVTLTNAGVFGMDGATPILPPGESAILAFGQVRRMPWVRQERIEAREVATLALSFDHRTVDGDLGSAVLRDVADMLADPLRLLAWA